MSSTFYVEILTPERKFFWGDVETIIVKTPTGEMGILKGHIPTVVVIDIGSIKIKKNGKWFEAVLSEGFMEVKQDQAIILVDTAEWPDEIDINRAKAAKARQKRDSKGKEVKRSISNPRQPWQGLWHGLRSKANNLYDIQVIIFISILFYIFLKEQGFFTLLRLIIHISVNNIFVPIRSFYQESLAYSFYKREIYLMVIMM